MELELEQSYAFPVDALTPTLIGVVDMGIDGRDAYFRVNNREGMGSDAVHDAFMQTYYADTQVPGGYYCHVVRVFADPITNDFCVVVQHRYNV